MLASLGEDLSLRNVKYSSLPRPFGVALFAVAVFEMLNASLAGKLSAGFQARPRHRAQPHRHKRRTAAGHRILKRDLLT